MSEKTTLSIAIGSDHAGFSLKEVLKSYLIANGYELFDCGTYNKDSVDYPKYAYAVAKRISDGKAQFGIIVDGSGIGSAVVANKVHGIRAAMCYDLSTAKSAREHNDANVLTLGAGLISSTLAKQIVDVFLSSKCTVERYLSRVKMVDDLNACIKQNCNFEDTVSLQKKETNSLDLTDQDIERVADKIKDFLEAQKISLYNSANVAFKQSVDNDHDTVRKFINLGVERISNSPGITNIPRDIAKYIDHTLLNPDATIDDILKLCSEAKEFEFASVCINPTYVPLAAKELAGTHVHVCAVVGFPHGNHMPEIKAHETRRAIRDGAKEIDMVINIGALKNGNEELLYKDIRMVAEACEDGGALSKVIIEAALLTDEEKIIACKVAKRARANFVKTSTGFGPGGATKHDVELMSRVVRDSGMGVKAAGGIKTIEDFNEMITAGATRIGASAGVQILEQAKNITVSE
ncbi:deoxyribose-phosphate aldolase [bacterium]|nr:deoxyribose-phosphate aldolase [bacterium]